MIQALLELFGGIFAFAGHITGGSSFPEPLSPEEEKDCIARLEAGDAEARHGIVLAKNDAAKRCGVATGNPLWLARQRCPGIIFIPPDYDRYLRYSELTRELYGSYTDRVEPYGLDECWLDVTESAALFGDGKRIADDIRRRIRAELG